MEESEIASQLQAKVQQSEYKTDIAPDTAIPETSVDHPVDTNRINELIEYKLHTYFNEAYSPGDDIQRRQINYIYSEVADSIKTDDYGLIIGRISELERLIGISQSDDRLSRLYQWLKLDNVRKSTEAQMFALRGI